MFRDIRVRKVQGLLSHQADILRAYVGEPMKARDVALQLPTGSGKTLVGLLIGEWRRRKNGERVVYLCPTKQLVHQVVEQSAADYGIRANAFTGKQSDYSASGKAEYQAGEVLAVTTYSAVFNTNPFFDNANVLILDDAHAAEQYVASYWSLQIDRKEHADLYKAFAGVLQTAISTTDYERLTAIDDKLDWDWVEKVPGPALCEVAQKLRVALDTYTPSSNLKYPWSVIRDHLDVCNVFISRHSILVRPNIPPTATHAPFSSPNHRLYMSATLGEGGELERLSGCRKILRLPVPEGWDKQGVGRRLFFFPERSLDPDPAQALVSKMVAKTPRALILVPDEKRATELRTAVVAATGYTGFSAPELESSKQSFTSKDKAVAVIANRYEGIDLVGDECRLLVVQGLPRATHLQERFLVHRMASKILLDDRIMTRISQAVGRCTRSATDYAAVVVLGDDLSNYLLQQDRRAFLHPEFQAELEFGIDQSKDQKEPGFLDNLSIFLEHKDAWGAADAAIVDLRQAKKQAKLPATEKLRTAVEHEVAFQYALWDRNWESALNEAQAIITALSGPEVQGYRSFWYYLAGSAAWVGFKSGVRGLDATARELFKRASASAPLGIGWFSALSSIEVPSPQQRLDSRLSAIVEGLERNLERLGMANDRRFEAEIKDIRSSLASKDSTVFEQGHEKLGKLLGYHSGNVETTAAPDPWWIASDDLCIVFEDHSPENAENAIGANKVRQVASHPTWIRANLKDRLRPDASIVAAMISPCVLIDKDAATFAADCGYWNMDAFRKWADDAIDIVRKVRSTFPGAGVGEWRSKAGQVFRESGLDPESLVKTATRQRLADLAQPKAT